MGLFDCLKPRAQGDETRGSEAKVASLGKTATDIRLQAYDRDEALRQLIELGTSTAASALLKRFGVKVDPSITDEDEKQLVFDGILAIAAGKKGVPLDDAGRSALRQAVIERVRSFCEAAETLTWAIKLLRSLLVDEDYERELLALLERHDTEYVRNVEPKVNLLAALESVKSPGARRAVEAYLSDVNETVRYHAVQTLYAEGDAACVPALVAMLAKEESVRIKNKVAEGLARAGWSAGVELRDALRTGLRDAREYRVGDDGEIDRV